MKLGMQVGLGPGHIVLDGDPGPLPRRGTALQFLAHICCGQMAGWIKMPLSREVGLNLSSIVLDGDPSPLPKRGQIPLNLAKACMPSFIWSHPTAWPQYINVTERTGQAQYTNITDRTGQTHRQTMVQ